MASVETQFNSVLLYITTYIANNSKLIVENTITGGFGLFLALGSYASIFSHGSVKTFLPNAAYLTKISLINTDQIFEILESLVGLIWIPVGVSNFSTKYLDTTTTKS
jgi:hypothetical protein